MITRTWELLISLQDRDHTQNTHLTPVDKTHLTTDQDHMTIDHRPRPQTADHTSKAQGNHVQDTDQRPQTQTFEGKTPRIQVQEGENEDDDQGLQDQRPQATDPHQDEGLRQTTKCTTRQEKTRRPRLVVAKHMTTASTHPHTRDKNVVAHTQFTPTRVHIPTKTVCRLETRHKTRPKRRHKSRLDLLNPPSPPPDTDSGQTLCVLTSNAVLKSPENSSYAVSKSGCSLGTTTFDRVARVAAYPGMQSDRTSARDHD